MNLNAANMQLSSFQLGIYQQVVADHAAATEHTAYCCGIVEGYTEILKSQPVGIEASPASSPAPIQYGSDERMATVPQVRYVRGLMATREISRVEMASWGAMLEQGLTWDQASTIIDRLKDRTVVEGRVRMATKPQLDYARKLLSSKVWEVEVDFETLTFAAADKLIDNLKAAPAKQREVETGTATEGVYLYEGTYVKVQRAVHGSGQLYTKAFDAESESWERAFKLLGKLKPEHKLTEQQAARFGELYGRCVRCFATLTDEFSIEHGYGPICAQRMGF